MLNLKLMHVLLTCSVTSGCVCALLPSSVQHDSLLLLWWVEDLQSVPYWRLLLLKIPPWLKVRHMVLHVYERCRRDVAQVPIFPHLHVRKPSWVRHYNGSTDDKWNEEPIIKSNIPQTLQSTVKIQTFSYLAFSNEDKEEHLQTCRGRHMLVWMFQIQVWGRLSGSVTDLVWSEDDEQLWQTWITHSFIAFINLDMTLCTVSKQIQSSIRNI